MFGETGLCTPDRLPMYRDARVMPALFTDDEESCKAGAKRLADGNRLPHHRNIYCAAVGTLLVPTENEQVPGRVHRFASCQNICLRGCGGDWNLPDALSHTIDYLV